MKTMISFDYTIKDELGIHARPAGMLAKTAKSLDSEITITKGEKTVGATKLMALMGLGVKCGDTITVTANGGNEAAALEEMKSFLEKNL
ncbi:MAG: HPr family phosphocarrier protein [Huintestinicola sp.]